MSNSPEAKRNAGKIPAALPSTKRKSSLLSGQGPIDVSILKEDEKKMILMGVSVQAAQNSLQNTTSLNNAIDSLKAMANSMHGKKTNVWAPPFQLRITDSEVNSTSGKKPFTEYSVLVMPRGSNSTFVVKKRYSHFCELNNSLQKDLAALTPTGLQFAFVDSRYQMFKPNAEVRREMLNAWLIGIVYDSNFMLTSSIFYKLTDFFDYFDNIIKDDIVRGVSVPTLFR
jgi:hypothetical protein